MKVALGCRLSKVKLQHKYNNPIMTLPTVTQWMSRLPFTHRVRNHKRLRLPTQVIILVASLVAIVLLAQAVYLNNRMAEAISEQIGLRGLGVAQTVARMPAVLDAFDHPDPPSILQPLAQEIQQEVGSKYVVIGNHEGIRYSHPRPERIGLPMVGGDNDQALIHGEAYVSRATGSLGEAIRGKTAVFDDEGNIIGVVSVGFMMESIEVDVARYLRSNWIPVLLAVILGVIGSLWIARHIKREIFGLEPHQIAQLFTEKNAVLQSIHEGVVAVNRDGRVTMINQTARRVLGLESEAEAVDRPVNEIIPNSRLAAVLSAGAGDFDQETVINGRPYVVNRVPIIRRGEIEGAVATFRDQQEIMYLSRALNEASADVDSLRVQAHEFSNRLYTISGLLQLGKHEQALELIQTESQLTQDQVAYVMNHVSDPVVAGMLLSKMMLAVRKQIDLQMATDCSLQLALSPEGQDVVMRVLGNLIDNAFDAVESQTDARVVRLFFTDMGEQVVLEVEDNGPGVSPVLMKSILEKGFTTKAGEHQGIGLAMVAELCERSGGQLYQEEGDLAGACFVVTLGIESIGQVGSNDA